MPMQEAERFDNDDARKQHGEADVAFWQLDQARGFARNSVTVNSGSMPSEAEMLRPVDLRWLHEDVTQQLKRTLCRDW